MHKEYLGDAVYANWDGYHVVLTTEDGVQTFNTICLDPEVLKAFARYLTRLSETAASEHANTNMDDQR